MIESYGPLLEAQTRSFLGAERFQSEGEDLLQTIRLSILGSLGSFRERDRRALTAWIKKLAQSRLLDWEKAKRSAQRSPEPGRRVIRVATDGPEPEASTPTPSRILMGLEAVERLQRAINSAPERYRGLLRFISERDPSPAEVAAFLGKEPEAARKFAGRALVHLQHILRQRGSTTRMGPRKGGSE